MDSRPTVGSLFSGIGGIDLGLERVGFRPAWFCERNEWCQKILAKHWPEVHCYHDIHDIGKNAPSVDLLAGGFPCQPVSVAGKRLAEDDPRWLWPEFGRLIRILRPRAALLENVPGLFTSGFGIVLSDLAALGYDAEWDCIPAAAVGAPHRRDRVFIIATPRPDLRRDMADALDTGSFGNGSAGRDAVRSGGQVVADPTWEGLERANREVRLEQRSRCRDYSGGGIQNQWEPEPAVGRVAHGIPRRVDRLRGLGNAVVPQVAEVVGRRVMEILRGK